MFIRANAGSCTLCLALPCSLRPASVDRRPTSPDDYCGAIVLRWALKRLLLKHTHVEEEYASVRGEKPGSRYVFSLVQAASCDFTSHEGNARTELLTNS
ncbi:hypothetical protein PsYK624_145730 [Phanerochaete sordida]|uniref:Uncharacterized protein n=1 Tax=Phanerochaete sordida TaxID=48140 RepID=A0A9P3GMX7_9APHY|nr:hypothetical protein PsYK624_145730 [Phanerochaete sordida]